MAIGDEKITSLENSPETGVSDFLPKFLSELPIKSEVEEVRDAAQKLMRMGIDYCVDGGCNGDPIYLFLQEKSPVEAPGVQILNRSAFLNYIEERYPAGPESARGRLYFELLDIKDFRSADKVKSPNGENGAEIVLRRFAKSLVDRTEQVNKGLLPDLGIDNSRIVVCRYGGDEFGILFENVPEEMPTGYTNFRETLRCYITGEKINEDGERETDVEGIFLGKNGNIEFSPVKLKQGKDVEGEFGIPEDLKKARIFWEHLQSGLLLRENQIDLGAEEVTRPITLMEVQTPDEVMKNIVQITENNPKILEMFKCVEQISSHLETDGERENLYRGFERFLRDTVCDRLLSYNVESMRSFAEQHMGKPFKKIHVVDAAGLKEVNDIYGLEAGDEAIVALWNQVLKVCKEQGLEEPREVRFFRRGSTMLICETEKGSLTDKQRENLFNIGSVRIERKDKTIEIPISHFSKTSESGYKISNTAELRSFVDELFNGVRTDFHSSQLISFAKNVGGKVLDPSYDLLSHVPSNEEFLDGKTNIDLNNFYKLFLFGGSRMEERVIFAKNALSQIINEVETKQLDSVQLGSKMEISNPTVEDVTERLYALQRKLGQTLLTRNAEQS
jgi:GGDEF domain-containing protein